MPERHENEFEEDYDSRFEEFGMDDEYDEKKPFSEEDDDDDDYSYPIDEDDDFLDDEDEIDWDSFDFEDD